METENILVVKRISDDFDKFVSSALREYGENIDVMDAYRFHGRLGRKIVSIVKRKDWEIFFPIITRINVSNLEKYQQIILFDDYPDLPLIKWIKKLNSKSLIKLWFWNVPNYPIDDYKKYCELYCFDKEFCQKEGLHFIDQFYFDHIANKYTPLNPENDVVYIGIDKNRKNILAEMIGVFSENGISYNIKLIAKHSPANSIRTGIDYKKEPLPYSQVLEFCAKSKAIIELVHSEQMGLTWRSLEALFLRKKLITNNKRIKEYDFYNPHNIFIYGEDDNKKLNSFINAPFVEVNYDRLKKYTFQNWYTLITKELNHENHQEI